MMRKCIKFHIKLERTSDEFYYFKMKLKFYKLEYLFKNINNKICNYEYNRCRRRCSNEKVYNSDIKMNLILDQVKKLEKFFKYILFKKKMKTLWRIAEYYTAKKYHPDNILKDNIIQLD